MNINLHIDSIVLDGIELGPGQHHLLHEMVTAELTTLLNADTMRGVNSSFQDARSVSGGAISFGGNTAALGTQLAQRIHGSIIGTGSGQLPQGGGLRQ